MTGQPVADERTIADLRETNSKNLEILKPVAMVISVFSRPPFNEKWQINGIEVNALPAIPEAMVEILGSMNRSQILGPGNANEQWEIGNDQLLDLITRVIFSNEDLPKMLAKGWIKEEDIEVLKRLSETLIQPGTATILAKYPPTSIINSYSPDFEKPLSMVLLGGKISNSEGFVTELLTKEGQSKIDKPRASARITDIPETESIVEALSRDLKFYLTEEELVQLFSKLNLQDHVHSMIPAEVEKVEGLVPGRFLLEVATTYFSQILKTRENLPKQAVYYTLPGTPVYEHGLKLFSQIGLENVMGIEDLFYEEEIIDFARENEVPLRIGILRLKNKT